MRVIVSAGGTAGHTSPCEAVIEALRERDPLLHVQWIGRAGAIEERVAKRLGVSFRSVPMEGWPRKQSLRRLVVGGKLAVSCVRAATYIRRFRPQIVIGFGGYVTLPVLWAAQRAKITTAIHEQNSRLGMANRLAAKKADRIFLSFDPTLGIPEGSSGEVCGNPVRGGFLHPMERAEARRQLGLDVDRPVLLVTGGSQGAQRLNEALAANLKPLADDGVQVIWLAGKSGAENARVAAEKVDGAVQVYSFLDDMPAACAAADVIVSRAGASSTAEIAAIGRPSILVPYPFATDNHQEANARALEEHGAARVLLDDACTADAFLGEVRDLIEHPQVRERMADAARAMARPDAAGYIANELVELGFGVAG